ncbi:hypothetical protein BDW75DRAFT_229657 [Aspergillus navahoensis]
MLVPWKGLRSTIATGGAYTILYFSYITQFVPLESSDASLSLRPLQAITDYVLRADQDKLLERYCGGEWAGLGFAPRRIFLALLHQETNQTCPAEPGPAPLWSPSELLESKYIPGTDNAGLLRLTRGLQPLDVFIELTATSDQQHGLIEFGRKILPMPGPVVWLNEQCEGASGVWC